MEKAHQGSARAAVHALIGGALLVVALWGLRHDLRWVAQPFYAWAWWGYIFLLDAFCLWKRGDSLLTTRVRFLLPICAGSITFWFFFELINARIKNWYYVGVYPADEPVAGVVFTLLAFSTVFLGIFQTYDAITATGLWRRVKGRTGTLPRGLTYWLQAAGVATGSAALLFPHYLAPLVWGSFTLVVDPWNYRRGARSLLRDLEHGDYGLPGRLLLSGLACGVVWESLNFFAPQKWIYTVRGLEGFKLFEMPLLGFLGFPALALDAMAGFALLASFLLGNRTWERAGDLRYTPRIKPVGRGFLLSLPAQALFWAGVAAFATPLNIGSLQLRLADLNVSAAELGQLESIGIGRPRQLLRRSDRPAERAALQERLGWDAERFDAVHDRARLYTFKGIGVHYGRVLEQAGIRTPDDLGAWTPEALHARLGYGERSAPFPAPAPRLDLVRVWVLAAPPGGS